MLQMRRRYRDAILDDIGSRRIRDIDSLGATPSPPEPSMSTTADLVIALKAELKASALTYAAQAERLGIAESSVKRMFSASGDMPLSRIDAICRALNLDFADLARSVAEKEPLLMELSLAQEKAVVGDRRLLLVAICCLSHWALEQIVATYQLTEAEVVKHLVRLDRLGVIDLRPGNRYLLKVA
jgi:DNA-binding Xre family transcriptional regulator